VTNKTAKYIAHLIPLLFIYKSVPVILSVMNAGRCFWRVSRNLYCYSSARIIGAVFSLRDYLKLKPRYSDKPIDNIQVIMIVWIVGITIIISRLFVGHAEL
jgi:miniconductance mechanosensitive channel